MRILNPPVIVAILGLSMVPRAACGQQTELVKIVGVRVGLADRYKAGLWTQVEVTLRGESEPLSGRLSVIVPDGDGVPGKASAPPSEPCDLWRGHESTVRLLTRFGRVQSTLTAEFRVGNELLASKTFQTAPQVDREHFLPAMESQKLIVIVGTSTLGVEQTGKGIRPEYRPVAAQVEDVERLPTHWCGYEGVDAVILSTSRPEIYRRLAADGPQLRALDEWIRMGGRLVLCVGAKAAEVLSADSPLRQFAPGRLDRIEPLRQTSALEAYCGGKSSMSQSEGSRVSLRVPRLADLQGTVEAREADLPLVVRTARGFGQIIFLAVDLDQPPLVEWLERPLLVAGLLDMPAGRLQESDETAAMMHYGYNDLSGQLRSALDRFEGVWLVPFWLVAGLIVAYLLLIGPGDYFFLRKLVGRMEWTWLTFPLVVLLAGVGACWLAYRLKGDRLKVNQVDLVDVDAASGGLRGTTWLNVFSPRMESFNFSVQPQWTGGDNPHETRTWMAWWGLPGAGLGGMNARAGGPAVWTEQFRYAPRLDALWDVPIQVWSTKSLTARWSAASVKVPPADLVDAGQVLSGTITNTLGFPLSDCILAHGRLVYEIGTMEPGEPVQVGPLLKRSELKTLLTGKRIVARDTGEVIGDKYRQETTPYDQSSTDLPYILRMMMFYGEAGGRRYTGLWNSYQGFVDLSDLLKADRAILVGQGPESPSKDDRGAELLRDGQPLTGPHNKHVTMYRFVFPIKKE